MTTSAKGTGPQARSFRPGSALAKSVTFADEMIHVALVDGRIISAPLLWFPRLHTASAEQRERFEISGGGIGLHWPDLDEDLSVAGLLAGADELSA
jgi:hypothetical protein